MAKHDGWLLRGLRFQGQNNPCVRINRFSKNGDFYVYTDANNNQQSDSLGDNSRDMSSWLNDTAMDEAKDWTNSSPSIPTAPTNLTVSPGNCYGSNFMSWNGSDPNTLQYYLEYSDISSFSSPQRIYTGWSNSKNINVTTGTWYLRVRACNISGCSAYSNQVSASRINTCS